MEEALCVVTFKSIHRVVKGEHLLKSAGIWTDMIPNPRGITTDCGMSIRVRCSDIGKIRKTLSGGRETDFKVYRKSGDSYTKVEEESYNGSENQAD